ncbi:conserved membrane hypothetical protein [Pseudomonas sp. OF001]|uniref:hypothetical protein n=1 Tax=unclassified Pseudomonas TaxID=196821 RepID=UPI0010A5D159|nr:MULTISPECIES: hypothetical protein [unclassified Pseudomonas]THG76612.1 hypothetical protein E5198_17910 [Pseudomonas sp. A-1]CAD5375738.1 conserved membrane hypothetical protein [Pseudomonas sp. OF001]
MNSIPAANPFAPPRSDLLHRPDPAQPAPSIEEALARGYDFSIGGLLGEAWGNTRGIKWPIIAGFLAFYAVLFAAAFVLAFILAGAGLIGHDSLLAGVAGQLLLSLLIGVLTYPFFAGILMIGIRRAAQQPVGVGLVFGYFGHTLALAITGMLVTVLVYLGTLLLILPGIYLGVAYLLAMALVVERGLSPWQAMEASRQAISQHWFKVFGLLLLLGAILLVSALPLGIGLIWSLPLSVAALGVLYREIFGVLPTAD